MYVESSNVRAADYDDIAGELIVQYKDGSTWAYTISKRMADAFFEAASKGGWLWDHVKVRGPGGKHLHRVPARQLA